MTGKYTLWHLIYKLTYRKLSVTQWLTVKKTIVDTVKYHTDPFNFNASRNSWEKLGKRVRGSAEGGGGVRCSNSIENIFPLFFQSNGETHHRIETMQFRSKHGPQVFCLMKTYTSRSLVQWLKTTTTVRPKMVFTNLMQTVRYNFFI